MKTPPFLLLAALAFWGWQSGFLLVGAIIGVVLELTRLTNWRWDLDDADFHRIFSFCMVLNVAFLGYAFTTNEAGGGLNGMLHGHTVASAVNSSVQASTRFLRWLPMTFFPFIAAQVFNLRPTVPLTAVSPVLRWRRRKGDKQFVGQNLDVSFPYFIVCLIAAGIHTNTDTETYFWGSCVLIIWALWSIRSRRFGMRAWAGALGAVIGLGFLGQFGINEAQRGIENFNAQWMSRFFHQTTDASQSLTSIGQIGELKLSAKIVIWLEPEKVGQAPVYLREASYRNYHPQRRTWDTGGSSGDFQLIPAEADGTSWVLMPGQTNMSAVNITCYLNGWSRELDAPEGLLPLPTGSRRLENIPSEMLIKKNPTGAVLAAGRGLLIFDALYRPGAGIDSPPNSSTNSDLTVPPEEKPALDQVISEMNIANADPEPAKLLAIEKFLVQKFSYSIWQGPDKKATTNATSLTRFLLTSRSGHCEYFATATVLLLRELGIPARYAVGYAVHETSGTGYIVRERDAHAWCLVWNAAAKSWDDFDTTPPSWVAIEGRRASFLEWLSDFKSWLGLEIAKFRWREAHLQQYIFWSLIPVLVVLLYYIIFHHKKKRRDANAKKETSPPVFWPGLDSEFYQLEKRLAARGVPRQPGEPLSNWLERALAEPALADLRAPLKQLLRWHYRHRFDPLGLNVEEREKLKREAKVCLDTLLQAGKSS